MTSPPIDLRSDTVTRPTPAMTPAEALVAATGTNATLLGLNRLGVMAAGKEASFNVLDANPLENITNTRRIDKVYLRGAEVDRKALRAKWTRVAAKQPGLVSAPKP